MTKARKGAKGRGGGAGGSGGAAPARPGASQRAKGGNPSKKAAQPRSGAMPSSAKTRASEKEGAAVKVQAKPGRPTSFTKEIGERIIAQIADGVPLITICEGEGMPNRETVRRWRAAHPEFRVMYAHAREELADTLVDELLKLADEVRIGVKVKDGDNGKEVITGDMVERTRLQIDTRKWLAAKILPKKYGDKVEVEHSGEQKHTIRFKG